MADYIAWLRGQVGPALLPLAYVTAIVRDPAGRVLFQRRADFGAAWWGLPGGLFEIGETPDACLRREVLEETGLQAAPRRLVGVYSSLRYRVAYPNGDQAQQVTWCYECDWLGGALRPQAAEILELAFFPPDAFPPRPLWYADMLAHALGSSEPAFDPPEPALAAAPFPTLMSLRAVVGTAPLIWPGASAAVRDAAGRLLFQRRVDTGQWGLPGGGLDTGETLAHTAQRETREETGLEVEPVRLLAVTGGYHLDYSNGDRTFPIGCLFACRWRGGAPRADGRESSAVAFFAREALPPLTPRVAHLAQLAFDDPRYNPAAADP
jgi:ADP-ribose pyrophosphatase YjhB (NUDIX family)